MLIKHLNKLQKKHALPIGIFSKLPKLLLITINNDCNLRCAHCDWLKGQFANTDNYLETYEWEIFLDNFSKKSGLGEKILVISGKEPLVDEKSRQKLVQVIGTARKDGFMAGFITNGTRFDMLVNEHPEFQADFIDISIEGTRKINDLQRGQGCWEKAMTGALLAQEMAPTVFISTTLTAINIKNIPEHLKAMSNRGFKNFVFHSLIPGEPVENGLKTQDSNILNFLEKVGQIQKKIVSSQMILDFYPESFDDFPEIIRTIQSFKPRFFVDKYIVAELDANFYIRFINTPQTLTTSLLFSPEGHLVDPFEIRDQSYLKENMPVHVRNFESWPKENPYQQKIIELIENIPEVCFNQDCFKFCLGQNKFCPLTRKKGG